MKKDTYYFPHDFNARSDRKMVKLKLKQGAAGIGAFWCIVEMLYEDGGKIPLSEIPTIAQDIIADEILVTSLVNDFDLFKNDGIHFWSESVNRRLAYRLEKSEKARESAEIRWNNANAMRTHSDGNAIKGKEKKEKEIKKKESKDIEDMPPTIDSLREFFKENGYLQSLADKAFRYYTKRRWIN